MIQYVIYFSNETFSPKTEHFNFVAKVENVIYNNVCLKKNSRFFKRKIINDHLIEEIFFVGVEEKNRIYINKILWLQVNLIDLCIKRTLTLFSQEKTDV